MPSAASTELGLEGRMVPTVAELGYTQDSVSEGRNRSDPHHPLAALRLPRGGSCRRGDPNLVTTVGLVHPDLAESSSWLLWLLSSRRHHGTARMPGRVPRRVLDLVEGRRQVAEVARWPTWTIGSQLCA